jgi:hypothetical protein
MPHIQQAAGNVLQGYQKGSALKRLQSYFPQQQGAEGTSPLPNISPINAPQVYQDFETAFGTEGAKVAMNSLLQQQKMEQKEGIEIRKEKRGEERKLAETEQVPYYEQIAADRKSLNDYMQSSEQMIDAIKSGEVDPLSLSNIGHIATDLGVPASITNMLETPGSKEFNNGLKQLMGHTIKDTFRGNTTGNELKIAQSMQAEIGVRQEANLAAALSVKSGLLLRQERLRLHDELLEQGVSRSKIPAIVEKKLESYRKKLHDDYFEAINHLRGPKK